MYFGTRPTTNNHIGIYYSRSTFGFFAIVQLSLKFFGYTFWHVLWLSCCSPVSRLISNVECSTRSYMEAVSSHNTMKQFTASLGSIHRYTRTVVVLNKSLLGRTCLAISELSNTEAFHTWRGKPLTEATRLAQMSTRRSSSPCQHEMANTGYMQCNGIFITSFEGGIFQVDYGIHFGFNFCIITSGGVFGDKT